MYEIDRAITPIASAPGEMVYCDFLEAEVETRYTTIVGNPPFVRTRTGNLYLDFVRKCTGLLVPGGELVFVVPSDFFKLTCAAPLLAEMTTDGAFTDVFHPHDESMFAGAAVDVLVFRYCRGAPQSEVRSLSYNDEPRAVFCRGGMVTFGTAQGEPVRLIGDTYDVFVGSVSGAEGVFKHAELGDTSVLVGENTRARYLFPEVYPTGDAARDVHLLAHKPALLARRIRAFGETNWFEWGAARNVATVRARAGADCVYVHTLTRRDRVAFRGVVELFGGNLLMVVPRTRGEGADGVDLDALVAHINSAAFRQEFVFSGRFRIGQRQLRLSPDRPI
jgi:adenine-specific DNA-methyltransferase